MVNSASSRGQEHHRVRDLLGGGHAPEAGSGARIASPSGPSRNPPAISVSTKPGATVATEIPYGPGRAPATGRGRSGRPCSPP